MNNQRYKYITLSQLLSSVAIDLHMYDNSGLIREDTIIKTVHKCNDKLGIKLHRSKQCLIDVKDYKAYLPDDFWKIELVFATYLVEIPGTMPLIPGNIVEYTTDPCAITDGVIVNNPKITYKDACGNCLWAIKYPQTETVTKITKIIPLNMGSNCKNQCTYYTPTAKGEYGIDLDNNEITTNFKEGQIFLCYLGAMENEDGEVLIPFHPLLNDFYEYSVKEKIFEDIFLNSEDDVEKKLQYIIQKKKEAYIDAWQFTGLPEYKELERYDEKRVKDFYNKWFNIFNY